MTTLAHNSAIRPTYAPVALPTVAGPRRGCEVLDDLRARPTGSTPPGVVSAVVWAAATVGIAPGVLWPVRFKQAADAEGKTLRCLADWAGSRVSPAEARELKQFAGRVRFAPILFTLGLAGALVAALAVAWGLTHTGGPQAPFSRLMGLTFGFFWPKFHHVTAGRDAWAVAYAVWTAGLLTAYVSHLVQVHLYAHRVRQYLDALNRVLVDQGAPPAYLRTIGWGFAPLWVIAAVVMLAFGGIWAIPLAVAGATDRRYRRKASPKLRANLAERVRTLLLHEPTYAADAPAAIATQRAAVSLCQMPGCGRPMRSGTKFCPRCGSRRA